MIAAVQPYIALMRLNKPIGTLLLLWPTLIALWLASNGAPDLRTVTIFVLGVLVMRSAGCVINDYADRDFDIHVQRTKQRPLTSGQIKAQHALMLFSGLLISALILALQLKFYTILLASVAGGLAILYPFTKRFSNYPQLYLGLAFAWSIPMAYAQVQSKLPLETWLLFVSTVAWVIAYDTLYAMADKADDLKLGIKSTAITFGAYDKQIVFALQCISLLGFAAMGMLRGLHWMFYASLVCALILCVYQQWLCKARHPAKCFAAFLNNNYFGMVIFLGIFLN
ncbi:MAG TPA: 4-hydroxybenzoate octaprenyltransferase [Gammaproteobacteria bacterium]|nr:4-hydroxybenzoate octaprenyltransferase [Gammaproteobacteria bacterium]